MLGEPHGRPGTRSGGRMAGGAAIDGKTDASGWSSMFAGKAEPNARPASRTSRADKASSQHRSLGVTDGAGRKGARSPTSLMRVAPRSSAPE
eukprot:scaffold633086_cov46-Prasinocladus_malaysianus.AAC.1